MKTSSKTPPSDWDALDVALQEFAASGCVDVREDGEWLAELAGFQCELRWDGKQPVIHVWSDKRNLTRRVVSVRQQAPASIELDVMRFGRAKPVKLEFVRKDFPRNERRITREQFRSRFERVLAEKFPDARAESLTISTDKEHTFSGLYVRGTMREGSHSWALLAASKEESASAIEGILALGLLWLDWTRNHSAKRAVDGLRIFVPDGTSRLLRERLLALGSNARVEIYEMKPPDAEMRRIDLADAGNLKSWLTPRRDVEGLLHAAEESLGRLRTMWPETAGPIETRVAAGNKEVALCCRGMEFARWTREGVVFGLGNSREPLTERTEKVLERTIQQLDLHRSPLAHDQNHWLYRAAPERWLESMVLSDPVQLDALLDPRFLYSQVPALTIGERGVMDLLGITRQRRLVVIELKASVDIQLPLQAVDYWLRVRRHQIENDFQRDGYFVGVEIDPRPPLVWLVAPALQFHSSSEILVRYLLPEIQVTRIGLSENWRRGLKVMFRK